MVRRLELPKLSNGKQSHEGKKEKKKFQMYHHSGMAHNAGNSFSFIML